MITPDSLALLANSRAVTAENLASIEFILVGAGAAGKAYTEKIKEKAPHVIFREGKFN